MERSRNNVSRQEALKRYSDLVRRFTPKSRFGQGCFRSFWVGGLICTAGQAIGDVCASWLHLTSASASSFASIVLIFLTALLTGLGSFDRIAHYAGAGTVVPITGFANAMVSPAMEFKPEGWVLGTGGKMFSIAGPVLVYGVSVSVIIGILYCFIGW